MCGLCAFDFTSLLKFASACQKILDSLKPPFPPWQTKERTLNIFSVPVARLCVGVLEEMGAWEHPGEPLVAEGPGSHLGPSPVLGGLGAGLGQSWGHLGASLGLSWGHPVSYWASFWEILVCPAGVLEALLGEVLGRSWGILPSSGRPGNLCGIFLVSLWVPITQESRSCSVIALTSALPLTKTLIILLMLERSRAGKRGMAASVESVELSMMSCAPRWTAIRSDQKT